MLQKQMEIKRNSPIVFVAAFGLITMSSGVMQSQTTVNVSPYFLETYSCLFDNNTMCNSSMLSKQAIGDIVYQEKKSDFVQQHEKKKVCLKIVKIEKHVSDFDFEEVYEEI